MKNAENLIEPTEKGFFCPAGGFYIDPGRPVARAVITHAHADHARPGCESYLATPACARLLEARLGAAVKIQELAYGEPLDVNGIRLSLHPAGHILGSAQVRLERGGQVWAVTGDFKLQPEPTCAPFEPLRCHTLITESTFGLPVFAWPEPGEVAAEVNAWWRRNGEQGRPSLLFAYSLGKAQRIAARLDAGIGPVFTHGAVEPIMDVYRQCGIHLCPTRPVSDALGKDGFKGALVLAPPAAEGSPWIRRFPDASRAFASGWMRIRGNRRRRALDRGFVLSDHADWRGLLSAIDACGAERVWVTHGFAEELVRYLVEKGTAAAVVTASFAGEPENGQPAAGAPHALDDEKPDPAGRAGNAAPSGTPPETGGSTPAPATRYP
jgi:putative mRNA 3-end processing factor